MITCKTLGLPSNHLVDPVGFWEIRNLSFKKLMPIVSASGISVPSSRWCNKACLSELGANVCAKSTKLYLIDALCAQSQVQCLNKDN